MKVLQNKPHVCWITSGHLCSNPRLIKEAKACSKIGVDVSIIACQYLPNFIQFDIAIAEANPEWNIIFINATKNNFTSTCTYYFSAIAQKISNKIYKYTGLFSEQALSRLLMWQYLNAKKINANLFIAHNMAALPIAVNAAKKRNVLCGFDAEDYHRGELENNQDVQQKLVISVEEKYFPSINYFTAASPLIAVAYKKLYPNFNFHTILNVFSKSQIHLNQNTVHNGQNGLKLFWFSQTVGLNRGLQDVIKAMNIVNAKPVILTIIGIVSAEIQSNLQALLTNQMHTIVWLNNMKEDQLINESCLHDIGLALEPAFSINNDIALSNKIFTYLLAGNAIIASNTSAQELFMKQNSDVGFCYTRGNYEELAEILDKYANDDTILLKHKEASKRAANQMYNWEMEQNKFIEVIQPLLQ